MGRVQTFLTLLRKILAHIQTPFLKCLSLRKTQRSNSPGKESSPHTHQPPTSSSSSSHARIPSGPRSHQDFASCSLPCCLEPQSCSRIISYPVLFAQPCSSLVLLEGTFHFSPGYGFRRMTNGCLKMVSEVPGIKVASCCSSFETFRSPLGFTHPRCGQRPRIKEPKWFAVCCWRAELAHAGLVSPGCPGLLRGHCLSSGSVTLTPPTAVVPLINNVPISALHGINYLSLIGLDSSLVLVNQLMRICHQSCWCPPERLVTAARVETGAGKVGEVAGESPGGSFLCRTG